MKIGVEEVLTIHKTYIGSPQDYAINTYKHDIIIPI